MANHVLALPPEAAPGDTFEVPMPDGDRYKGVIRTKERFFPLRCNYGESIMVSIGGTVGEDTFKWSFHSGELYLPKKLMQELAAWALKQ